MIPLLAEDGAISNDLFKYLCGGLVLAVVGLAGYIVKLHATGRADMLANLPVLTLAKEMLESAKTAMEAMSAEIRAMREELSDLRKAIEECRLR